MVATRGRIQHPSLIGSPAAGLMVPQLGGACSHAAVATGTAVARGLTGKVGVDGKTAFQGIAVAGAARLQVGLKASTATDPAGTADQMTAHVTGVISDKPLEARVAIHVAKLRQPSQRKPWHRLW